jgi:hypothetical protein
MVGQQLEIFETDGVFARVRVRPPTGSVYGERKKNEEAHWNNQQIV